MIYFHNLFSSFFSVYFPFHTESYMELNLNFMNPYPHLAFLIQNFPLIMAYFILFLFRKNEKARKTYAEITTEMKKPEKHTLKIAIFFHVIIIMLLFFIIYHCFIILTKINYVYIVQIYFVNDI